MKKHIRKITAPALCAVLIFSLTACSPLDALYGGIFEKLFSGISGVSGYVSEESGETTQEAESGSYDEEDEEYTYTIPDYTGFDETELAALCKELSGLASGEDFDDIAACFEELSDEFDLLYDQELLAYLEYCKDAANTDLYEDYNELYLMAAEYSDEAYMAMKEVLEGPCADEFAEYIGEEAAEELEEYEELTDQELEWAELENDLVAEYNAAYEEFEASGSSDYEAFNETAGPIYLELVALRTEMARYYGYDDYAQYADEEIYGRDISTEEAEVFHEVIKTISSTYYDLLYGTYAYFGLYYADISYTADSLLSVAYSYGNEISPYITRALDLMIELGLCDIDEDEARINGSFSTTFSCGAPTLFINMNGWSDFQTLTHELGHCVNSYLTADNGNVLLSSSGCYDILEIHSNGLEALFTNYYDEIFGTYYYGYAYSYTLMELMLNVVDGSIYDEFQRTIYENPDMTLDEINDLFESICEEYGDPYASENKYSWALIPHNFESPMYYLSYGLSGLAALEIWSLSTEDYDAAVDVWEEIVSADAADTEYLDLLDQAGLSSFLDDGVAAEVCTKALDTAYSMSSANSGISFYYSD